MKLIVVATAVLLVGTVAQAEIICTIIVDALRQAEGFSATAAE
jgi:hypothetical protein